MHVCVCLPTCAIPLLHGWRKTIVTATLETANGVPACSVCTQALKHFTFIHIYQKRERKEAELYCSTYTVDYACAYNKIKTIYCK